MEQGRPAAKASVLRCPLIPMRAKILLGLVMATAGLFAACGGGTSGDGACTPGQEIACDCGFGAVGRRTCNANGSFDHGCECDTGLVPMKDGGLGGTDAGTGGAPSGGSGGSSGDACVPQLELCDNVDNDCNGLVDDTTTGLFTWYEDKDGDGFGNSAVTQKACAEPAGFAPLPGDCNDDNPAFHPGASEANCDDPNDYDCDGTVGFVDADGDTFPACQECDDTNANVYPGAIEVCDGKDDDCDGSADFPGGELDGDGDGLIACADCDDSDPTNACDAGP